MEEDSLNEQIDSRILPETLSKERNGNYESEMPTDRQDDDVYSSGGNAANADPDADGEDVDGEGDHYAAGQGNMENELGIDADGLGQDKAEYGDEMGDDDVGFSNSAADLNQEELEAIIESITSGKS